MSDAGLWRYRAALVAVTDGDSLRVTIDAGFGVHFTDMHLRLLGLNTPEVHGPQREAGLAAQAYVQAWCQAALDPATAWPLLVETVKDKADKYGNRWLARVYRTSDMRSLNDDLIAARFALPWDGTGPKPT